MGGWEDDHPTTRDPLGGFFGGLEPIAEVGAHRFAFMEQADQFAKRGVHLPGKLHYGDTRHLVGKLRGDLSPLLGILGAGPGEHTALAGSLYTR